MTFSGRYAYKNNQLVRYITERAVFSLEDGEVTLIEIAPGIDLDKDVLQHMDFQTEYISFYKNNGQQIIPTT